MDNIPSSYHQGLITATTVVIAFSLAFIRYWSFEATGTWWWASIISEVILVISIVMQVYVLARALNLKHNNAKEYTKSVKWLIIAVSTLIIAVLFSTVIYSDTYHK